MRERTFLELHVGMQINLGRLCRFVAEPKSDHAQIHPTTQEGMAAACLKVWGVTVFGISDGQLRRAVEMCRETSRWNASALRRPPFELGKTDRLAYRLAATTIP